MLNFHKDCLFQKLGDKVHCLASVLQAVNLENYGKFVLSSGESEVTYEDITPQY